MSASEKSGITKTELRSTRQRDAIRAVFCQTGRPLSVSEVLEKAQKEVPSLNSATVYRNLNRLVDAGWLVQVIHSDAGTLYERADKAHHHHFYCRCCGRLFELSGCPLPDATVPEGFLMEGHELFFRGVCRNCCVAGGGG